MWAGLGLAIGALVTYVALDLGSAQLVNAAPAGYSALFSAVATTLLRFLVNALLVMLTLGVVLALAGWLAGATPFGRRTRLAIAGAAHRWGSPLAGSGCLCSLLLGHATSYLQPELPIQATGGSYTATWANLSQNGYSVKHMIHLQVRSASEVC